MLIKMYCLGIHGYFASLFNRFDCLVSVTDYMQHVVGGGGGAEVKSSPWKIGSLGNYNGNGSEIENWIRAPPNFITLILLNLIFQLLGRFSGFDSKGQFTRRWGTPGRWDNPLRWGNPPVHIISHLILSRLHDGWGNLPHVTSQAPKVCISVQKLSCVYVL